MNGVIRRMTFKLRGGESLEVGGKDAVTQEEHDETQKEATEMEGVTRVLLNWPRLGSPCSCVLESLKGGKDET